MKKVAKIKTIYLITVGILFALSLIITHNLNFTEGNKDKNSGDNEDINLDNKNLKISKVWGKIYIYNNWSAAVDAGICTGNGSYSNPYIIEDLVIDAGGSGSCILIESSVVYFEIQNCTLFNSETNELIYDPHYAGIHLIAVSNSRLVNNNCSSNSIGILLEACNNNTISGNIINNNTEFGIYMWSCDNNTVSGNSANSNDIYGIHTRYCNNNTISSNTVNDNNEDGIFLFGTNNTKSTLNTVSGNVINNNIRTGLDLFYCNDTVILGNDVSYNGLYGISLRYCNSSTLFGNNVSNNNDDGIRLRSCDSNNISGNRVNNNYRGINLVESNSNIISNNEFKGNVICWVEDDCEGNIFENNTCIVSGNIITGYNLFFLVSILSIVIILITKKVKKP